MQSRKILDHRGNEIHFGYKASRPSWKKQNDILDRSSILETEDKVLQNGNRLEMLSTLRDLERNNPICRSIVQVFVSNLGQCTFNSETGNTSYDEQRNILFKSYYKNCEVSGFGMQRVLQHIIADLLLAGEVFILLTKGGGIQLLPSERIASSHNSSEQRENEHNGIVTSRTGRATSYRVCQIKDGVVDQANGDYVTANNMIHISNNIRIGQQRGTPMLASATQTLQDIHEVQTAYTAKVKVSSALTGFITSNQPYSARWDGEFEGESVRSNYKKLYSGSLLILENGESVETIQGGAVDGVDGFLTQLISFACSSVGITVENLVGWSNASFSSSKATREVTNHRFKQIRDLLEDGFLRRLSRWRTYKYENNGELAVNEDREMFEFQWTRSPTLDRQRDAQTDALLVEKGLASKSTVFANNGLDYREEMQKIAEDSIFEKELLGGENSDEQAVEENQPSVKEMIDAYGAGVRAGTLTPQIEDENHFRAKLGLEPVQTPIVEAWEKDGGTRRPITLKSQEGFEQQEDIGETNTDEEDELTEEENLAIELATYNDYPESARNNAKRAIKYKEENDVNCGTAVGWTRARQLANGESISRETIARMASFKRHQQHKDVPYKDGCGGLMWDAWGGASGIEWAIRKLESIDKK